MIIFNALQTSLNGGIGRYSYELAKSMYELQQSSIKVVIREEDYEKFEFVRKDDLIVAKGIKTSRDRNLYEQFVLPRKIAKEFPDAIIHYPDSMAPLLAKNKVVITVHDLAFKTLKGAFTWKTTMWKSLVTTLSVKKAHKIICITNFAKTEVEKHYPNIDNKKLAVVYNGFNDFSKTEINEANVNKNIKEIKKPYILTVSTISPRKNIDGLIIAFNNIKDKVNHDLVIAGRNGWLYEHVYELVTNLGLKDRVVFTGGVNDDELKYLYKNADLFTYVSLYEGFGLPPLEAMSYGVPCVVSDKTSIPEVCGEDATYVDPYSYDNISEKLLAVSKQEKPKEYKQVNRFSWEKCAKDVVAVYKSSWY